MGDDVHLYVAVLILGHFATDLRLNQEDFNYVNGRKRRINAFLPCESELLQLIVESISLHSQSPMIHDIISAFIGFFNALQKSVLISMFFDIRSLKIC